ncbi:hypothetical protein CAG71_06635 [Photobacterium halotolerans]|nr:2OG-Fe dioxygenase family protein [Photobacterium halotolerans]NAW86142.1 hypothetical protein [Photobacterium halotolerans]
MGDGGTYRYRRYGQLQKSKNSTCLTLHEHGPYIQSRTINQLNGGVARYFDPLTKQFLMSPVLEKIILFLSEVYDAATGMANDWNIRLHPYRILANERENGKPTPEGLHRDGVTYIATLMINRVNIEGGTTIITDNHSQILYEKTLILPLDLIVADDALTMHEVSSVQACYPNKVSCRDVLVIAFTIQGEQHD